MGIDRYYYSRSRKRVVFEGRGRLSRSVMRARADGDGWRRWMQRANAMADEFSFMSIKVVYKKQGKG
jgi:hypothetical protein